MTRNACARELTSAARCGKNALPANNQKSAASRLGCLQQQRTDSTLVANESWIRGLICLHGATQVGAIVGASLSSLLSIVVDSIMDGIPEIELEGV